MVRRHLMAAAASFVAASAAASAQSPLPGGLPPPSGMPMPVYARHRFPQPVLVGTLLGEVVQQPVESQRRLGSVRAIVREADGTLAAVIRYGGWFGRGGRDIAVPLDALALLGRVVEAVGFSPRALDRFPTYDGHGAVVLPAGATVRVGLAKPSH